MTAQFYTMIVAAGASLILAVSLLILSLTMSRVRWRIIVGVAAFVLVLPSAFVLIRLKPEIVDGRFRTYKQFYGQIQVGMSRSEVMGLIGSCYPREGKRLPPIVMRDTSERLGFFMNPESSTNPNCEAIIVQLRDGKVVRKFYAPD